eukprot:CAMPEP_0179441258 /NCGR_PEP_ID=MMETSP0799-20121207/24839_1 /TAXON_ID=46947 /ORGANISM="Geminigera cryophila, Strain CCMP2564" /LENGTH=196 /DNA_ID=CAMNT_0021225391 /DNA_START=19 /DNA_END=606 /DNA_ORIENTATION=-
MTCSCAAILSTLVLSSSALLPPARVGRLAVLPAAQWLRCPLSPRQTLRSALPTQRKAMLAATATAADETAQQAETEHTRSSVWGLTWYPLQFERFADKSSPSSCTVLGAPVVFWWDPVARQWAAALDVCPHRLAPLSEGRVCPLSGDIECPYHGWTFKGSDGTCTKIPQMESSQKINQKRASATALPVELRNGIIW